MSQVTIEIGGRNFDVVCQEGEEEFLRAAAAMLDTEASKIDGGGQRVPESRMLLMAGLMLADRTAATEDKLAEMEAKGQTGQAATAEIESKLRAADVQVATLQARVAEAEAKLAEAGAAAAGEADAVKAERDAAMDALADAVERVEKLAG